VTRCSLALLALGAFASEACTAAPVNVGESPEMLWWTDHETGDLSDWTRDGGGTWTSLGGTLELVDSPVRSGKYALRASVSSNSPNVQSSGIGIREALMPNEACYSAWFFVPTAITTTSFWLFFKFRSRTAFDQPTTDVDMWDLDVVSGSNGSPALLLYRHDREEGITASTPNVPIARWFQLEACLLAANDSTGHLRVWLDGEAVFELNSQLTMPSQWVEWNVGSIAEAITPTSASIYVDDAAISTRRLGPDYPVFWRAP